ncbi:MAG: NAD(P)-dependent oxidoreductase [Planctomycetota bacterium]
MKVALTGASGFIGSNIAQTLAKAGHDVIALVRETSRRDHIEEHVADFVVGDAADREAMAKLCTRVDAVVHNAVDWSAAIPAFGGSKSTTAYEHFRTNVTGSLDLLETARLSDVGQFLFISSGAVNDEIVTSPTITETHPTWSGNLYGAYKASIEPFLKAYRTQFGMNTSSWRPVAVYGVDPTLERSQWFNLIDKARRGEKVDAPGGGKITHVQDIADAITFAIGDDQTAGEIYNLAERYLHKCVPPQIAAELSGSGGEVVDYSGSGGPKNQYDTSKAVDFFDRHGHEIGLRRGLGGVRQYVANLLSMMG